MDTEVGVHNIENLLITSPLDTFHSFIPIRREPSTYWTHAGDLPTKGYQSVEVNLKNYNNTEQIFYFAGIDVPGKVSLDAPNKIIVRGDISGSTLQTNTHLICYGDVSVSELTLLETGRISARNIFVGGDITFKQKEFRGAVKSSVYNMNINGTVFANNLVAHADKDYIKPTILGWGMIYLIEPTPLADFPFNMFWMGQQVSMATNVFHRGKDFILYNTLSNMSPEQQKQFESYVRRFHPTQVDRVAPLIKKLNTSRN